MVRKQSSARRSRGALCDLQPIELPKPAPKSKRSLARALQLRRTIREISAQKLSLRTLSDLLWAACGVNRKKDRSGSREGLRHRRATPGDRRLRRLKEGRTCTSRAVTDWCQPLPVTCGVSRLAEARNAGLRLCSPDLRRDIDKRPYSGFHEPGLRDPEVSAVVLLRRHGAHRGQRLSICRFIGLATWFHNCDRSALSAKLRLRDDQRVLFGQTVGYPDRSARAAADLGYLLHKNLAKIGNEDHEHSCRR